MKGNIMGTKKVDIFVKGVKDGQESVFYTCSWDGALGEWMDIGKECVVALHECDTVSIIFENK